MGHQVQAPDTEAFRGEISQSSLPKLLKSMPGVRIETMGFDGDHLHMVMVIPPKYAVSDVMGQLKSRSSSDMRKTFKWLSKV